MMRACLFFFMMLLSFPGITAAILPEDASPDFVALKEQIERGQEIDAISKLEEFLEHSPGDADILNLLGYANRRIGEFGPARDFYIRALDIDPDHLGVLEYFGELELQEGNIEAAVMHLEKLQALCPNGCHELEELQEAFNLAGVN